MSECLVCNQETEKILCEKCLVEQGGQYTTDQKVIAFERWFNDLTYQCSLGNCPAELGVGDLYDMLEIFEKFMQQQQEIECLKKDILSIKEVYENGSENDLDEVLYGLFTNEPAIDYSF